MHRPLLHKSIVLSHRQCPKRAWLAAARNPEVFSRTSLAMQAQGEQVHAAARAEYPHAPVISNRLPLREAAAATQRALQGGAEVVLEAAFAGPSAGARVDILRRAGAAFDLIEVKSGGSVKDAYLDDAGLQVACLRSAGVPLNRIFIQHPDTGRPLQTPERPFDVFTRVDVTEIVTARSQAVVQWIPACADTLAGPMPHAAPGAQCDEPHECPFKAVCGSTAPDLDPDRIAYLPSKAGAIKAALQEGKQRITELPASAFAHERNALVWEAVRSNSRIIRRHAIDFVRALPYPRHFVDFEAIAPAIPRVCGMRPYQPLVFQWSVDRRSAPGAALVHSEYLDTTGLDPRRDFALSLLRAVGEKGPVIVFSGYEKCRLRELADLFDDLREALLQIVGRIVDLLPIARRGYYHPAQLGRWSIKNVQPTLPAEPGAAGYADLDGVADGLAAQAAYIEMVTSQDEDFRRERRSELLAYCAVDTRQLAHFTHVLEAAALADEVAA